MSTTNKQTNACFQHREDDREIKSKDAEFWISFTSQSRRFIMGDGQSHSWKYGFILSQVNTAGTKCDQTNLQLKLDFFFFCESKSFAFCWTDDGNDGVEASTVISVIGSSPWRRWSRNLFLNVWIAYCILIARMLYLNWDLYYSGSL